MEISELTPKATPNNKPDELSKNLNRILANQFLSIMFESQTEGGFIDTAHLNQFKSFLIEQYAQQLSDKQIFFQNEIISNKKYQQSEIFFATHLA